MTGKSRRTEQIEKIIAVLGEPRLSALSGYLAYSFVLAGIPLLVFVLSTALRLSLPVGDLYEYMELILPESAFSVLSGVLDEIVGSAGLSWVMLPSALGFIAMGVRAVLRTTDILDGAAPRGGVRLFIRSFIYALLLFGAFFAAFTLIVFGDILLASLKVGVVTGSILSFARYPLVFIILFFLISLIYSQSPIRRLRFREVRVGALSSCTLLLFASFLFSVYVNRFDRYGLFFGSLGGVFILLVWLYWCSYILLLGVSLNRALRK